MENFVTDFRKKYPHVPESLYGKFAKPTVPSTPALQNSLSTKSASTTGPTPIPTPTPTPAPTVAPTQDMSSNSAASIGLATGSRPKIKIALKRNGENGWVPSNASSEVSVNNQPDLGI